MAKILIGSLDLCRTELDKAREAVRIAEARVCELEAKYAERSDWLARILEGLPMSQVHAADTTTFKHE
jgi:hypothetical protein